VDGVAKDVDAAEARDRLLLKGRGERRKSIAARTTKAASSQGAAARWPRPRSRRAGDRRARRVSCRDRGDDAHPSCARSFAPGRASTWRSIASSVAIRRIRSRSRVSSTARFHCAASERKSREREVLSAYVPCAPNVNNMRADHPVSPID
jgi:hypothetical protein